MRSDANVYFDEAFIEFETAKGKDSISLKTVIGWLSEERFINDKKGKRRVDK